MAAGPHSGGMPVSNKAVATSGMAVLLRNNVLQHTEIKREMRLNHRTKAADQPRLITQFRRIAFRSAGAQLRIQDKISINCLFFTKNFNSKTSSAAGALLLVIHGVTPQ